MESALAQFEANPASTPEEGDELLGVLLQLNPANDVRWKAIQAAWKRCSSIERTAQWLKNRAKKLEAENSKRAQDAASGYPKQSVSEVRPNPTTESDHDRQLKELIIMALDHQLAHGGSGSSGEGLMGAMAQAFGDSFDDHAFHTSCEFGRLANVEHLRQCSGIDLNFRYKDGSTPLLIAMKNKHIDVSKALVGMDGVDLNCRWVNNGCDTPLILAVDIGREDLVKEVLSKRADVNIQNSSGATALHRAASIGNTCLTELLLEAGASVQLVDKKSNTALQIAVNSKHNDVASILQARCSVSPNSEVGVEASVELDGSEETMAIRRLVDSHLASHKIAEAHSCVADWASQDDEKTDAAWHLHQLCYQNSPFVWQHHKGLIVEKCAYGLCVKTRLPIRAQEAVLAECAAVPWTLSETRNPDWVDKYLRGNVQGSHTLSENESVAFPSLLEGLWPRNETDFQEALTTFPESVQKLVASSGDVAAEPIAIARSTCNSHHDGTHLSVAFFNHSCSPNCEIRGRYHVQLFATRDIEVGEELTISYLRLSNLLQPSPARKRIFKDTWASECCCSRCIDGSNECHDSSFYHQTDTAQNKLSIASATDFLPLALMILRSEFFEMDEPWKANLVDLVVLDAIQCRLQQNDWHTCVLSSQREDLLRMIEAMLQAFLKQKAIVGESKLLKPLCQAILQLESLYRKTGSDLPDGATTSLQQVRSLELLFHQ